MASILILDDEDAMREALRMVLEEDGHEVNEASDGISGIELYRKRPTDVVVTDLIMPQKDGIETIRDLRREFPRVKIIALSGRGGTAINANLERAKRVGADLTLLKPCEPSEIREAIRSLMEPKKKAQHQSGSKPQCLAEQAQGSKSGTESSTQSKAKS